MTILAEGIISVLGDFGPYGVLMGIYLLTAVFGQFVSNTATAVLFRRLPSLQHLLWMRTRIPL